MTEFSPNFSFHFRRKSQWCNVFLWDVHPNTFANWGGGRWGYFDAEWENSKSGLFGSLHFVKPRLRIDTIVHELDHVRTEWMLANGTTITRGTEERMASFLDELVRNFLRELKKAEKIKL